MRWDLSDVDEVPEWHTPWFNTWVLPIMLRATESPEQVQDIAVRVWVFGPNADGDVNMPAQWHWEREAKVVKQRAKPNKQRAERLYGDDGWDEVEDNVRNHVLDPDVSILDQLLFDAPPAQRGFLVDWAVHGFTVEEASRRTGISRATGYRWRDDLIELLRGKWSSDEE